MQKKVIQTQGFHLSNYTYSLLNEKIKNIESVAPNKSTIKAIFNRNSKNYKGVVKVNSSLGPVVAIAYDKKLKNVTLKLIEQVKKQINKLKSKRLKLRRKSKYQDQAKFYI